MRLRDVNTLLGGNVSILMNKKGNLRNWIFMIHGEMWM